MKSMILDNESNLTDYNIENNIQDLDLTNIKSLFSLMYGKKDSICRMFNNKVIINKQVLETLNQHVENCLSIQSLVMQSVSIFVSLHGGENLEFSTWCDFIGCRFDGYDEYIQSVTFKWDFLVEFPAYPIPQNHSLLVRISSDPKPSDVFKAILSGAFDEDENIEVKSSRIICKVDFINNVLANHLVTVVEKWIKICKEPISTRSFMSLLAKKKSLVSDISQISCYIMLTCFFIFTYNWFQKFNILSISNFVPYLIMIMPLSYLLLKKFSNYTAQSIFDSLGKYDDFHVFDITTGDETRIQKISDKKKFSKSFLVVIFNIIFTIIYPIILKNI